MPVDLRGVTAVAAGSRHTLALKEDGTVVAWGLEATVPAGLTEVVAIAANGRHSMVLRRDRTVVAWGDDTYGQSDVPSGLRGVIAIAAGERHSLALTGEGTVVAWGDDTYGQSTVPAGLTDVIAIAGGGRHSLALKRDGTVVAWGDDTDGQVTVPAGLRATAIAAGRRHSVAITGPADTTSPTVSIGAPEPGVSYVVGQTAVVTFSCQDEAGGSGVASCAGEVDGTAVASGGLLPTSAPGTRALTVTARDNAGNTSTAERTYVVFASFGDGSGRVQPPPAVSTAVNSGAAVPIELGLGAYYGTSLFASGSPSVQRLACDSAEPIGTAAPASTRLSYDAATDRYNLVWKTDRSWAHQCWELSLTFDPSVSPFADASVVFRFAFLK